MSGDANKSLGKGSPPPGPVQEGLIRLYSMRFCPYAHRTRLVLYAKGIKHEIVNINLKSKPDWYFTKHPFGQIPVLENSKCQLIWESAITCPTFDQGVSDSNEMWEREHGPEDSPVSGTRQPGRGTEREPSPGQVLAHQQTTFFGGNFVSMIDYLFWPWFERLDAYGLADCVDHTPKLRLWMAVMKQDPAVCALFTDKNVFLGFLSLYFQNCPDAFDHGLVC
ncbi:glutathione S-transferase omega-2-like isoform X2 [Choloepus didactylus]|uniref:glutathione S-transferase omega-2-like isoform X2 n=1 Tax=Choloepus didactylus TaxID=27675 RepID=UPI00189FC121|nr:glutathione S-transferase omega-2-like isoform X2 [Choloepus didactylus]